jgi:hypothetical protein
VETDKEEDYEGMCRKKKEWGEAACFSFIYPFELCGG